MNHGPASVDCHVKCPYCDYSTTVIARDIRGQKFVLACLDCKETYVVEVTVVTTHAVRALADVDVDALLEKLRGKTSSANGSKPPTPPRKPPAPPRRMQGTRY